MSVANLEARLKRLKSEKERLKDRKSAVEKVLKKLEKKPADDIDDIKKSGKKTADSLATGVDGIKRIEIVASEVRSSAQSGHRLDNWEEKTWFNKEIDRLAYEIQKTEREIECVKAEIQAAREAELAAALGKVAELF